VKVVAKKIDLTPRNKPKKQEDKYKETSKPKPFKYAHNVGDNIIYKGIIEEYYDTLAIITKRSHKNQNEYYTIKFSLDDVIKKDIGGGILQSLEEYETELVNGEEKNINEQDNGQKDISEIERKIIEAGLVPMRNRLSCHDQLKLQKRSCELCGYESTCIYHKKYQYDKVKFD